MKKKFTHNSIKDKIIKLETAKHLSTKLKISKKKIILCHGTFDLLHAGHYRHFQEAKDFGDIFIVSITELSGAFRPFKNSELINAPGPG